MEDRKLLFLHITMLFVDVALANSYFDFISLIEGEGITRISFLPWFLGCVLIYAIDRLLLRHGVLWNVYGILNAVMVIGLTIVGNIFFITSNIPSSENVSYFLSILLFLIVGTHLPFVAWSQDVRTEKFLLYEDFTIFTVCLFLLVRENSRFAQLQIRLPLCLCILFLLWAIISLRVTTKSQVEVRGSKGKGILFIVVLTVLLCIPVFVIFLLFSDGVRGLMDGAVDLIGRGLSWVFHMLYQLLVLIAKLLPEPGEMGGLEEEPMQAIVPEETELTGYELPLIYIIGAGIGLFILVSIILLIYNMKNKTKREPIRMQKHSLVMRSKEKLWTIIKSFIEELQRRILFRYRYITGGDTVPGLYLRFENYGRLLGIERLKSESGREYLMRLYKAGIWKIEDETVLLQQFGSEMERYYYSSDRIQPDRKLMKKVRRLIRIQDVAKLRLQLCIQNIKKSRKKQKGNKKIKI